MRVVAEVVERVRALLLRRREERELDEELRFHVDMETEANVRRGMDPRAARREARLKLGGVEQTKEDVRHARGTRWLDALGQDLRFGWRVLARRPGFTLVAVVTLAVGIGATTSVFSVANAVLLRPVPGVEEQDGLAQVRFRAPHLEDEETGFSYLNFLDLRAADLSVLTHLAGWEDPTFQVAVPGRATALLDGAAVLGDYFEALGVQPAAGRLLEADETPVGRAEPVVVLSERARARLFGRGGDVLGRTAVINGVTFTVVGVAGGSFRGVTRTGDADLWIPYGMYPRVTHAERPYHLDRGSGNLHHFVVRLSDGAVLGTAERQLRAAVDRLVAAYPDENESYAEYRPTLYAELGLSPWSLRRLRTITTVLLAAVGLVLLIACANVANLLIFRGVRRRGESAIRQAIGASRGRLLRQHLSESGLLALGGVLSGLGATVLFVRLTRATASPELPMVSAAAIDGRVLVFAVAVGAATVVLAGLVPAVVVHRVDVVGSLKDAAPTETGRKKRLRSALTVAQLALSLALLVGALLLVRTVRNLHTVDLGFDVEGVVEAYIDPEPQGYAEADANAFQRELLRLAADIPGARFVGAAADGPLNMNYVKDLRSGDDRSDQWPVEARAGFVTPGFFTTLRVPLVYGRPFTVAELEAGWRQVSEVAILNEALARRLFGTLDVVGRRLVARGYRENETLRVVGVAADTRMHDLEGEVAPMIFRPLGEHYANRITLMVRSPRAAAAVAEEIRAAVDRIDPAVPFYRVGPLSARVGDLTVEQRVIAGIMTALAALAALLAGVGLYGIIAYTVAERTREIGIRIALGARGREVVGLVVRQSLAFATVGVLVGAGGAWALARALESQLFGVEPLDPATWLTAAAAFAVLALLAAAAPARAAVRVDPVKALKTT